MKQEFLNFLNALIEASPDLANSLMTDNIKSYIDALSAPGAEKPEITDNGKQILKFLQDNLDTPMLKARDIAEGLFVSSRTVSGSIRKLVNDGFVEKVGQDPAIYTITEKGKNYNIE
jgi:DNA-binding MarR family transcriptional regulator